MFRRLVVTVPSLGLAFGILLISVLRTASVKYEFSGVVNGASDVAVLGDRDTQIPYDLAYPGKVLPDSPLWAIKAVRDKLWLATTTNESRKAELLLLFADKRLSASKLFFETGKPEEGYLALLKAEHYLELACDQERANTQKGIDTSEFLERIALASLRHRQVIEEEIMPLAPDDARPEIVQTLDTAKKTFERATQYMNEGGLVPPENPFGE